LVRRPLTLLLYQIRMREDECGTAGGMRIGRGNRNTRRKLAPVSLCPPQIPQYLGLNPGRHSGKPATDRLSYGTDHVYYVTRICFARDDATNSKPEDAIMCCVSCCRSDTWNDNCGTKYEVTQRKSTVMRHCLQGALQEVTRDASEGRQRLYA
jgi:hypothetical protein